MNVDGNNELKCTDSEDKLLVKSMSAFHAFMGIFCTEVAFLCKIVSDGKVSAPYHCTLSTYLKGIFIIA